MSSEDHPPGRARESRRIPGPTLDLLKQILLHFDKVLRAGLCWPGAPPPGTREDLDTRGQDSGSLPTLPPSPKLPSRLVVPTHDMPKSDPPAMAPLPLQAPWVTTEKHRPNHISLFAF